MDIEKALKLKNAKDIFRAAKEAEARNVDRAIIKKLYKNYAKACESK